ncbi:hypothetical protein ABZS29_29245 [Kribbella sp. NPDC005582]|uniref:hypothetical protein n=1 Tax=Kribbella sp. NPDC005582 TaxID=3156893 RepID=UPI0033A155AB
MTKSHDDRQVILRKHRETVDRAMRELVNDLRAHTLSLPFEGSDEQIGQASNALMIYNEAFDLREHVASFFSTWIDD